MTTPHHARTDRHGTFAARRRSARATALQRLAAYAFCALAVGVVSCRDARFPVCKEDAECADSKGKKCVDLRCVECRGDDDCGDGRFCERKTNSCKDLGGPKPAAADATPPAEGAPSEGGGP